MARVSRASTPSTSFWSQASSKSLPVTLSFIVRTEALHGSIASLPRGMRDDPYYEVALNWKPVSRRGNARNLRSDIRRRSLRQRSPATRPGCRESKTRVYSLITASRAGTLHVIAGPNSLAASGSGCLGRRRRLECDAAVARLQFQIDVGVRARADLTGQTVAAGFAAAGLKPGEPVGYSAVRCTGLELELSRGGQHELDAAVACRERVFSLIERPGEVDVAVRGSRGQGCFGGVDHDRPVAGLEVEFSLGSMNVDLAVRGAGGDLALDPFGGDLTIRCRQGKNGSRRNREFHRRARRPEGLGAGAPGDDANDARQTECGGAGPRGIRFQDRDIVVGTRRVPVREGC